MTILCQGDFTVEELDNLEKLWIVTLKSHESLGGYNQTWGGTEGAGGSHKGKKRSPETCERIRQGKLGSKNPMFGKKNPKGAFKVGEFRHKPEIWKEKMRGLVWVNKDGESRRVTSDEASLLIGWQRGRK